MLSASSASLGLTGQNRVWINPGVVQYRVRRLLKGYTSSRCCFLMPCQISATVCLKTPLVHHQEDAVDPGAGGARTLRPNVVEPLAVRSLAKLALNRNALQVFLPSLCLRLFQFFPVR
jgi:hypothetical protein